MRLDALDKVLSETKYREHDPEGFAQLVQAIVDGDGSEEVQQKKLRAVWVNAQTMAYAMQKHGVTPEEIARKSPRVAEQFAEASQTGGLIKINIADYALNFSGSKIGEEIKPFLRTDPEGMSFHNSTRPGRSSKTLFSRQRKQSWPSTPMHPSGNIDTL